MKVKVRYFAITRELTNLREEIFDLNSGTRVIDLLKLLVARHNKLKDYIFDSETGNPKAYVQFMVDDNIISNLKGYDTILTEGSTLAIIPPVGGG